MEHVSGLIHQFELFLGVEVALSDVDAKDEDIKPDAGAASLKVLPPWMIKQGMQLTKEQRGEVKEELKMDNTEVPIDDKSDDKKSKVHEKEDGNSIQDEYIKAYYVALLKRQQETDKSNQQEDGSINNVSNGESEAPSDRKVGMKSKRDDNEEDDDVEWEDAPTAGDTSSTPHLNDLDVETNASDDDKEDEIAWEEG